MSKKGNNHESTHLDNQKDPQDVVVAGQEPVDPTATDNHRSDGGAGVSQTTPAQNGSGLESRVNELTHDLQRLQAEFANYKRREGEAKAELMNIAKQTVVMELLPLLDNIDRALAHRPKELQDNAWAGGVEQVGKQAIEALKKLGVERIESVGQPFDHNLHEAISMEDGDGKTEVVTEELQPGYKLGDRVIRHAMVKVGKQ